MSESSSLLPPEPWPQRISRILAWVGGAIILVGCSEKAPEPTTPAVPSTNAVPAPPK